MPRGRVPPATLPLKYNHFHEYDNNICELFEVRDLTPSPRRPASSDSQTPDRRLRGMAKFRNLMKRITGKRARNITSADPVTVEWSKCRPATLPRMSKEAWDAHLKELREELFGTRQYNQGRGHGNEYEFKDPDPFVPICHRHWKTMRCASTTTPLQKPNDFDFRETNDKQNDPIRTDEIKDPVSEKKKGESSLCWNPGFKPSEPEIVNNPANHSWNGFIPIDLSDFLSPESCKSDESRPASLTPQLDDAETEDSRESKISRSLANASCDRCGNSNDHKSCVLKLTPKIVGASLGPEVLDLIVSKLALIDGPPSPLASRKSSKIAPTILRIRDKQVTKIYANWVSIFVFQRLVFTIRACLDRFNPTYQGKFILSLDVSFLRLCDIMISRTIPPLRISTIRPSISSPLK